jgi:hypothetical protein
MVIGDHGSGPQFHLRIVSDDQPMLGAGGNETFAQRAAWNIL